MNVAELGFEPLVFKFRKQNRLIKFLECRCLIHMVQCLIYERVLLTHVGDDVFMARITVGGSCPKDHYCRKLFQITAENCSKWNSRPGRCSRAVWTSDAVRWARPLRTEGRKRVPAGSGRYLHGHFARRASNASLVKSSPPRPGLLSM